MKAVSADAHSVLVSWLPPFRPNGRLVRYTVYMRTMDGGRQFMQHFERMPAETDFLVRGLNQVCNCSKLKQKGSNFLIEALGRVLSESAVQLLGSRQHARRRWARVRGGVRDSTISLPRRSRLLLPRGRRRRQGGRGTGVRGRGTAGAREDVDQGVREARGSNLS